MQGLIKQTVVVSRTIYLLTMLPNRQRANLLTIQMQPVRVTNGHVGQLVLSHLTLSTPTVSSKTHYDGSSTITQLFPIKFPYPPMQSNMFNNTGIKNNGNRKSGEILYLSILFTVYTTNSDRRFYWGPSSLITSQLQNLKS